MYDIQRLNEMLDSDFTLFVSCDHCKYMAFFLVPLYCQAFATASDELIENTNYTEEQWSAISIILQYFCAARKLHMVQIEKSHTNHVKMSNCVALLVSHSINCMQIASYGRGLTSVHPGVL